MSNSATITPDQLRIVLMKTELNGKTGDSNHFSYAGLGSSSSSFGQMQFDVDANPAAQTFLTNNGFDEGDIAKLSVHGKLSHKDQAVLDTKLQAIPQAAMAQFTSQQMDDTIGRVGDIIDKVRKQNPAAADAIVKDAKLQLGIADYANQFPLGIEIAMTTSLLASWREKWSAEYKQAIRQLVTICKVLSVPRHTVATRSTRTASQAEKHASTKRWANSAWALS